VVGGGVTGLAAAHRAVEVGRERSLRLDVTLVEARERLGGTIATERAGGFLVEAGPDSFLSEKPWALALCRRLGVEDRLVRTDDRFRTVFVWFRGRLHPLPDGFQLLAPTRLGPFLASSLFSWPGKLRIGLDLVLPRGVDDDESLGRFVRRRLGRQALERVAQPLVAGIYTADPDELSLRATMPRFAEVERSHRSLILGLRRVVRAAPQPGTSGARWSLFVTFAEGMEELIATLAARLPAGAVVLKQRASGVERVGDGWRVATAEGGRFDADRLIVATESHVASRLLRYVDPSLAALPVAAALFAPWGLLVAAAYAAHPQAVGFSTSVMSEAPFVFLSHLALLLALLAQKGPGFGKPDEDGPVAASHRRPPSPRHPDSVGVPGSVTRVLPRPPGPRPRRRPRCGPS